MQILAKIMPKKFYNIDTNGQCYKSFYSKNFATIVASSV